MMPTWACAPVVNDTEDDIRMSKSDVQRDPSALCSSRLCHLLNVWGSLTARKPTLNIDRARDTSPELA